MVIIYIWIPSLLQQVHDLKEADGEPPKHHYSYYDYDKEATLVPPSQATPENIAKAKLIVSWLQAAGGQYCRTPQKVGFLALADTDWED